MIIDTSILKSALAKSILPTALAAASTSVIAQQQTFGTFVFLSGQSTGQVADTWVIDTSNGTVSYCSARTLTNNSSPIGSCAVIGNVGASASGFLFPGYNGLTTASNLQIVSKTTGAIFHCGVAIAANPAKPTGKCQQKSSLSQL